MTNIDMTNKDLIKKLQILRAIKPNEQWVISVREELLHYAYVTHEEEKHDMGRVGMGRVKFLWRIPVYTMAGATAVVFLFALGVWAMSQNSLPGDVLYSAKITAENIQNIVPTDDTGRAKREVQSAERRMGELAQLASKKAIQEKPHIEKYVSSRVEALEALYQEGAEDVVEEAQAVKASTKTLTIALSKKGEGVDLAKMLRTTVANRLSFCTDPEILTKAQSLLGAGDIASLIEANELTVRCQEAE